MGSAEGAGCRECICIRALRQGPASPRHAAPRGARFSWAVGLQGQPIGDASPISKANSGGGEARVQDQPRALQLEIQESTSTVRAHTRTAPCPPVKGQPCMAGIRRRGSPAAPDERRTKHLECEPVGLFHARTSGAFWTVERCVGVGSPAVQTLESGPLVCALARSGPRGQPQAALGHLLGPSVAAVQLPWGMQFRLGPSRKLRCRRTFQGVRELQDGRGTGLSRLSYRCPCVIVTARGAHWDAWSPHDTGRWRAAGLGTLRALRTK